MKTKDLIEKLQALNPEATVVIVAVGETARSFEASDAQECAQILITGDGMKTEMTAITFSKE